MKRRIAFILVIVMMATLVFPVQALAAYDKELTNAISTAKSLFDISDDYDNFTYNIRTQNDKTTFDLNWNDRKNKLGSVSVTIDPKGRVINYYTYRPYDSRDQKKLPDISKSDARKIADSFVRKVAPGIWDNLEFWPSNNQPNIGDRNYVLRYIRIENGIKFPENNVYVNVNGNTGQVESFRSNWYDDLVFPDPAGTISLENAQQQFKEKLGLKLLFQLGYSDQDPEPYLVYANVYNNSFIDAKSGQIVRNGNRGYYAEESRNMAARGEGDLGSMNKALSPEELKAVQNAASMMEQSKAEETARKTFNIESTYNLNWVSLYTDWRNKDGYLWNMNFRREEKNSGSTKSYSIGVSIDAEDGSIISFNKSTPYDPDAQVKYNESQSMEIAEDFIKSLQPGKFLEVERTAWSQPIIRPITAEDQPRESRFNYTRKINGAYFRDDGFNITVDNVTGTVTNYSFNWYNKPLPGTDKIISLNQAHKILNESIGIQMQYISENRTPDDKYIAPEGSSTKLTIRLVYGIKPEKPLNIDAFTGSLLDNSGSLYTEDRVTVYTDIKGHYAERQIKVLTEYGIALPGEQLNPSRITTQREFLYLLQKAVKPYFEIKLTEDSKDDEALRNSLTQAGILKDGEWSPGSVIARQDAARFIIRALKYDNIADINKGIYKLPFKDADEIRPGLVGYIAIAYGLNIINGDQGKCNPNGDLTRADAFIMLYNYLNV